jgi:2-keto-4-pentenoate hydratase/2-oxohepta-3-ene-1,7-dioic acid hydratase in catechol pathway
MSPSYARVSFGSETPQVAGGRLLDCEIHWVRFEGDDMHVYDRAPYDGGRVVRVGRSDEAHTRLACAAPRKVVCVGRNFGDHAKELGNEPPKEPLIFLKPSSAIIGPGAAIELPPQSTRVDHEAELGVIIGRRARDVVAADALSYVFGYTLVNDVTARDLQKSDGQWGRAKGFDSFCPVGDTLVTNVDPAALRVRCLVNGELRQDDLTANMIFSVQAIIEYVSAAMTLEPGDLLAMGTPAGVGPLSPGDRVEVSIDGVGSLVNPVIARR